jgi:predicted YcjX-like family ATPase
MALLKERHIRSESGIVDAFYHERLKAKDGFSRTVPSDALKPINSVVDGFEKLPEAISELYQGSRAGELRVGSPRNKKRRITMTMKAPMEVWSAVDWRPAKRSSLTVRLVLMAAPPCS